MKCVTGGHPLPTVQFAAKKKASTGNTPISENKLNAALKPLVGEGLRLLDFENKTYQVLNDHGTGTTLERYEALCKAVERLPGVKAYTDGEYEQRRFQFAESGISAASKTALAQSQYRGSYQFKGVKLWVFPPREFMSGGSGGIV
jgi:hypothetical protein